MKRRTFIKYSAVTTTGIMFPSLVEANWFDDAKKAVKVAFWASKLNPVRLVAGLIFDEIAEVFVEPLAKRAFHNFVAGSRISATSLSYYSSSSSALTSSTIEHEPYKASLVVYGKTDYEIEQERKVNLELSKKYDKERFAMLAQYLKDEKSKVKLYNSDTSFRVGSDITPNDLFNVDYIVYGNKGSKAENIENLFKVTNNSAFKGVVV